MAGLKGSTDTFEKIPDYNRSNFERDNLDNRLYENCNMRSCNFRYASLKGTIFSNVNLREADFKGASAEGARFLSCNLNRANFTEADLRSANFTGSDLRTANMRFALCQRADFTDCLIKGIGLRGTHLNASNIHDFLLDTAYLYSVLPSDAICYAFKLTNAAGYGIYHPEIKYEIGKKFEDTKKWGMALSPIEWVLKEWIYLGTNPRWHIFRASFRAGDVIKRTDKEGKYDTAKFNVSALTIEKEININKYYNKLRD